MNNPEKIYMTIQQWHFCLFIQGCLLLKKKVVEDGVAGSQKITRLWVHEVYRVFYDRLVDDNDRHTFFGLVKVRMGYVSLSTLTITQTEGSEIGKNSGLNPWQGNG